MPIPDRITYSQLETVYGRLGLIPLEGDPPAFESADGRTVFFHSPYGENEFYWSQVVEDIENTENLHGMGNELSSAFTDLMFELHDGEDDLPEVT